jgi:LacI family transcriptional regulator
MSKAPKPPGSPYPAKNLPDTDSSARPPTPAKVTIAEVARHAQVSPMTVSRVINDPDSVAEPRRMAVQQAIEALRYSPNPAAKALAGRKPVHLVLFYDNPSAAYLSTFLLGSLESAQRQHAQLTVIKCPAGAEKKALRELLSIGAQGVLLPPPLCDSAKLHTSIRTAGLLSVSVAGGARFQDTPSVRIDDFSAAAAMTRHLLSLGHRRIGFITGNPDQMASAERTRGYRAALAEAAIPPDDSLIAPGLFTYRSGLTACETLLDLAPPPTAVFASNDDMAAAAVAVAHRRHLDVPTDLTVCGFDDTELARCIWPELTTICQPISEMANAATSLLIDHIRARQRGRLPEPMTHEFQFSLIRRDSDAGPRT